MPRVLECARRRRSHLGRKVLTKESDFHKKEATETGHCSLFICHLSFVELLFFNDK
jgi:hypothetical protein